jgi:hypothetical protein
MIVTVGRGALRLAGVCLRPATTTVALSLRAERAARMRAYDLAGQMTLAVLDELLASWYADQAVARVLDSRITARALTRALNGELVEVAVRETLNPVAISRSLESRDAERLVALALDSPGAERLVARVIESRLLEETIARIVDETLVRLPKSPALWALVDEVAQSPAVAAAIAQQGFGFADQVADEVRERSRSADARLERAARRVSWRRGRGGGPAGSVPAPDTP